MTKNMYQKRKERKENKKHETYDNNKTNINWYPGHMAKTKREIKENLKLIDVVYEIIDARIPISSKIKDIDEIIKNIPRILIVSKYDLCDKELTNKLLNIYKDKYNFIITMNLNDPKEYKRLIDLTNEIMQLKNEKRISQGLKAKETKVLVIGIPNVGKSTLINRLAGSSVTNVGNNPGITKKLNWLKTKSNILLLDTPGILWPKFDTEEIALNLASMTAINKDILDIESISTHIIKNLKKYYPHILKERYKITNLDDEIYELYDSIGKSYGMIKNNETDYDKVSNLIINDIKKELIKGITFDRGDNY